MKNFIVRKPVLIPRPETENLIELILQHTTTPPRVFLDLCCGSGAICIALLRAWPYATAVAVDCSDAAVALTRENAEKFKVSDRLRVILSTIEDYKVNYEKIDLVVSNPPYIPSCRIPELQPEILLWEDCLALDGGADGMDITRQILDKFNNVGEIWLEMDSQSKQAEKLAHSNCSSYPDWYGKEGRFIRCLNG